MRNNWIGKILGEEVALSTQVEKAAPSVLLQVLGEEEDKKSKEKAQAEPSKATEIEPPESVDAAVEPGQSDHVSSPVQTLASLWSSGGKMDVAVKLLTEPVRYSDFVGLLQAIGPESALELGQILDDLVEGEDETQPPADNILNRVDGFKRQRSAGEEERRDFRERHAEGDVDAVNQAEQ